jgi:hypothetical protein
VLDHLRERMDALILEQYVGADDPVNAYFDIDGDGEVTAADLLLIGDGGGYGGASGYGSGSSGAGGSQDGVSVAGLYVQGMAYSPASISIDNTDTSVDVISVSDASLKTTITKDEKRGVVNWREIE